MANSKNFFFFFNRKYIKRRAIEINAHSFSFLSFFINYHYSFIFLSLSKYMYMATIKNNLIIFIYFLIFLTKQFSKFSFIRRILFIYYLLWINSIFLFLVLACQCEKQDNYFPSTLLTLTEYITNEQSTICSYDLNDEHYYCVYDVSIKFIF